MISFNVCVHCNKCGDWTEAGNNITRTQARKVAKKRGWRHRGGKYGEDICPVCVKTEDAEKEKEAQ